MLKITIETDEGNRIIDLLAEEQKAFEFVANMPVDWIENAIRNRVRIVIDDIVKNNSDKQSGKISEAERLIIVGNADIKSAKTRQEEFEADNT
jgi:hypothetical protein